MVLPGKSIPRRGIYLHHTGWGVFWVNLAGRETKGDFPHGWLAPEGAIRFGPYLISARAAEDVVAADSRQVDLLARGSLLGHPPQVAIFFRDQQVAQRGLYRLLTVVGRCRPSALSIHDKSLSSAHVALYWHEGRLWAVDLLSRFGTWIDGCRIDAQELPPECLLDLGRVTLRRLATMGATSQPVARNTAEMLRSIDARRLAEEEARLSRERLALEDARAVQAEARAREERDLASRRERIAAEEARLNAQRQQIERERAELVRAADRLARENIAPPDSIEPDGERRQQIEREPAELARQRVDATANIAPPDSTEPDGERRQQIEREPAELARQRTDASENIAPPGSAEPDGERRQPIEREPAELARQRTDASENIAPPGSAEPGWDEQLRVMIRIAELSRARRKWWPRLKAMLSQWFARWRSPLRRTGANPMIPRVRQNGDAGSFPYPTSQY